MHRTAILRCLIVPLLLAISVAAQAADDAKIRVLVITGGHAYQKQQFEAMFEAIPDIAVQQATYPDVAAKLTPELADEFDVVVFYDMWAKGITPAQQKSFVALLKRGIGIVALHHTLAAHQNWPEYAKIIGGKFHTQQRTDGDKKLPKSGFFHDQDIKVHVANDTHPITKGLKDFEIRDETYNNYDTDPEATLLLTTDHPNSDKELAWARTYENSRVVYLELGHDRYAYEHPSYRELVARSIRYAAGRVADPQAKARPLFNGKDLTGWTATGNASWEVKDGLLIGRQGEDNAPGDLFTNDAYADFELTVTYRVIWPANSGVWYRYQSGAKSYQADILEYKTPFALSGTVYRPGVPGKPFIAINEDKSIIDREGWNTLVIRVVGDRHVVYLNGTKTADVRDGLSRQGTIGFQVHAGDQFGKMQIIVREIAIREI